MSRASEIGDFFEPQALTEEDLIRTSHFQDENQRKELLANAGDMPTYLKSLQMTAVISPFLALDVPRIAQLINKSNQFNLTTLRMTETGISALRGRAPISRHANSLGLKDKFGKTFGRLESIVINKKSEKQLEILTWLMSCRVLQRQVEEQLLNEVMSHAVTLGCESVIGVYLPTPKNAMVKDLYPRLGFNLAKQEAERLTFTADPRSYQPLPTQITIERKK